MTTRTSAPSDSGGISYAQYLSNRITNAQRGVVSVCGPDITSGLPAWYEDLLPFLKDPDIRVLEMRARQAERAARARARAERQHEAG